MKFVYFAWLHVLVVIASLMIYVTHSLLLPGEVADAVATYASDESLGQFIYTFTVIIGYGLLPVLLLISTLQMFNLSRSGIIVFNILHIVWFLNLALLFSPAQHFTPHLIVFVLGAVMLSFSFLLPFSIGGPFLSGITLTVVLPIISLIIVNLGYQKCKDGASRVPLKHFLTHVLPPRISKLILFDSSSKLGFKTLVKGIYFFLAVYVLLLFVITVMG